jgi:hypothetical protein
VKSIPASFLGYAKEAFVFCKITGNEDEVKREFGCWYFFKKKAPAGFPAGALRF